MRAGRQGSAPAGDRHGVGSTRYSRARYRPPCAAGASRAALPHPAPYAQAGGWRLVNGGLMAKYLLVPAFLLSGALVASQTTPPPQPQMSDMMQQHQQMMAELKASDQRLEELVRAMNTAKGDAKIEAMAQVITELVHQQQAMHGRMGVMMGQMSTGMMGGKGAAGK